MSKIINIGPFTRINGLWHLKLEVDGNQITDAWSIGTNFRGVELILQGRDPRDAPYFTQRICGICSSAHAVTSSLALEKMFNIHIPRNGALIKNLIFGADLLQSHIRHIYLLMLPDFMQLPDIPPLQPGLDFQDRFSNEERETIMGNYERAMMLTQSIHEAAVVFGGKVPHNHGILAGGASVPPDADKVKVYRSILMEINSFIEDALLPDQEVLSRAYSEYFQMGEAYGNLISYGMFISPDSPHKTFYEPGIIRDGKKEKLDSQKINEQVLYAYYEDGKPLRAGEGETIPEFKEGEPYSWIKAPRYGNDVFETGPLARLTLSGLYQGGVSAMDRILARGWECFYVGRKLMEWVDDLEPGAPVFKDFQIPSSAEGEGLIDVMRGGLLHSIKVKSKKISHYQIITPSAWNCSPRDNQGKRGALEEALVGTEIEDLENPVEIGRIGRSFDVCGSCAVHIVKPGGS